MNVACFKDGAWTQLGDGLNGEVNAFLRDSNDNFLVGGGFSFFDEADPFASEVGLGILLDGTFRPHAGGVVDGSITSVRSLELLDNGDLFVGGCFAGVGMGEGQVFTPHAAILRADGTWRAADPTGGLVNTVGLFLLGIEGTHAALPLAAGDVLVGGLFTEAADHLAPNIVLLEDGGYETLSPADKDFLGVSGLVNEMASDGSALYVGGFFSWAGTIKAENVAKLDAGGYTALGGGLDGAIHALAVLPDGTPLAGGEFWSEPGGLETPALAQFKDGAWRPFVGTPDAGVFALFVENDGSVLVGGDFGAIGDVSVANIARIKDDVVEPLGAGLNGRVTGIVVDVDGSVVVSGLFEGTEQNPLPGIARFDGETWSTIGGGIDNDYGSTVGLYQGDIVVGGPFESVGGVPAKGLARWDGTTWAPIGNGLASEFGLTLVSAVASWGDVLVATGIFDQADGQAARYVAVYDGADWYPLAGGLNDLGEALHLDHYSVVVGGPFVSVDVDTPSVGVGRYVFGE